MKTCLQRRHAIRDKRPNLGRDGVAEAAIVVPVAPAFRRSVALAPPATAWAHAAAGRWSVLPSPHPDLTGIVVARAVWPSRSGAPRPAFCGSPRGPLLTARRSRAMLRRGQGGGIAPVPHRFVKDANDVVGHVQITRRQRRKGGAQALVDDVKDGRKSGTDNPGFTRTPMATGRDARPMTRLRYAGSGAGSTTGRSTWTSRSSSTRCRGT